MAGRQRKKTTDPHSDWWLWPAALLFLATGLGQSVRMWTHTPPEGLAPLTWLLWVGVAVGGVTLALCWLALRWRPAAWVATAAWCGVPSLYNLARQPFELAAGAWLYDFSPLLLLLLLGTGLGGAMAAVAGLAQRRWPGTPPLVRPWRQSVFAGLFVVLCGWLLMDRLFGPASVLLLGGALLLLETFFVIRETAG